MTTTTSIAERVHAMWASVAPQWGEHAEYVDARGAVITRAMLAAVDLRERDRVLELACGPGSVGLAAAAISNEVVVSDVAPEMVAIAEARARALGLAHVSGHTLDLEQIDEPDESYDVVFCREGLMFATDHAVAAAEIHRILRIGGRAAISVWGPRERNPWLGLVFDAVSAQLGMQVPPPGIPGPFSLADETELRRIIKAAGFAEVDVAALDVPLHSDSFDEWWSRTTALAGPLAQIVASLPPEAAHALATRVRNDVAPYATPSAGLEIPGFVLLATARR